MPKRTLINVKVIFTYSLLFFTGICFSQVKLSGKIIDDTTRLPLQHVIVFIQELNTSVRSNESGEFSFSSLPKGSFVVEFKLLGYKRQILTVHLHDSVYELNVRLNQSHVEYPEVVIYGANNNDNAKTVNDIAQLSVNDMRLNGAINLSDGISKIPGVSQLTTGAGISKPVIRGLFGNRIQTILMGLRFDNQQWQDEHGLGLSDVGIDRVEIIKGPASLLYGSEAMGGVINIIEERPAPVSKITGDVSTRFFSNTFGNATDLGIKGAGKKINWRIRAGEESHADYTDGNEKRILNSRFGGYYAKAGLGFTIGKWQSQNNYQFSQSNFGFLMDPVQLKDPPDDRLSRDFGRPHHTVNLNIFSSQNTFFMRASKLKVNLGFQNNNRQEQEGGNVVSLNMILNSYIGNATWTKTIKDKLEISLGTQDYFQTNRNIGSRTIIPDANSAESSLFAYLRSSFKHIVVEGGIRYDMRFIETFSTGLINTDPSTPGTSILPFSKTLNSLNGSLGFSWFNEKHWNIKSNVSTGYRAGNLAELSSNGLHEGTVRYEIGDINLKIEQNACADILVAYSSAFIDMSASAYYNKFFNYIYLAGTGTQYIGFDIYRYKQQDAAMRGMEATMNIHPQGAKWISWMSSYSYILGNLGDGSYMPFIPAPKLNSDIKLSLKNGKKLSEVFFKPGVSYVFTQDRPAEFETKTGNYLLVNAAAGITISNQKNRIQISLSGNNLLDEVYYDHLSRFKYYGVFNIGRNVSLNFKIIFN